MAMHAMTLDGLSEGRAAVGIGVSGPQVVEGWYGRPFAQPLARTREYVAIVREALRREGPVAATGPHYPLPYTGEGSVGLGKPLKMITHPLRADVPIYLGAEGPKNVALAFEIADGWVPLYWSPYRTDAYTMLRRDARRLRDRGERVGGASTTTSPPRCGRSRRRSASTSAAWARSRATSTPS